MGFLFPTLHMRCFSTSLFDSSLRGHMAWFAGWLTATEAEALLDRFT
jgi:hypothetical protein